MIKKLIYEKLSDIGSFLRPEIYKGKNIRTATVLEVVDELKDKKIVIESDNCGKKSGRRASRVELNKDFCALIGIDFKINYTSGVLIDFQGDILYSTEIESSGEKSLKDRHSEIKKVILTLKEEADKSGKDIRGIGFADPGVVDVEKGVSLRAVNIEDWQNQPTMKWLIKEFDVQDALIYPAPMARAFYENKKELNSDKGLFLMALGVGIGGAFIKNSQFFDGDNHSSMEIGHVVIVPDGPLCKCGNRGCLEAIAGVEGIRKKAMEMINEGVHTELNEKDFSIKAFVACVKNGDKVACGLAHEICETIGISLASIVAILNPSTIILSGELAELDDILLSTVKRTISLRCLPASVKNLKIKISAYNRFATAEGAAILLRNKIMKKFFSIED